jgi:hypothetical protein
MSKKEICLDKKAMTPACSTITIEVIEEYVN